MPAACFFLPQQAPRELPLREQVPVVPVVELGSLFLALPLEILCCSASKNAWGMWKTRGSGLPARSQTRGQGLAAERQRAGEGAGVIHLCSLLRVWDFHHRSPPRAGCESRARVCPPGKHFLMFSYVFSCFSLRPWPPALRLGRAWSCHLPPSRNLRAASRKAAL